MNPASGPHPAGPAGKITAADPGTKIRPLICGKRDYMVLSTVLLSLRGAPVLIRCPECQFERQIDADAIPPNASMATCPRCKCRFRFRNPDGTPVVADEAPATPEPKPAAVSPSLPPDMEGDDPLPPGAVVPKLPGEGDAAGPAADATKNGAGKPDGDAADKDANTKTAEESRQHFWNKFQKKRDGENKRSFAAAVHADETNVPWEEPKRYNPFVGLYQTILRVMFNAPRFFAALPSTNGRLNRPLVFYLILGLFQTLIERMWYLMSIQASGPSITDPKLQEMLGEMSQSMSLPLTILLTPVILAVQLCFFASVFYLMLRLVQPENVEFRTVFRVIAYSAAPTVVCIVPLVGPLVGSIWFGVCCFIGCKHSMHLPWSRTGLALGPLYLIAFAIGMQLVRQFLNMGS